MGPSLEEYAGPTQNRPFGRWILPKHSRTALTARRPARFCTHLLWGLVHRQYDEDEPEYPHAGREHHSPEMTMIVLLRVIKAPVYNSAEPSVCLL